jgi:hypothetical protein
MHQNFTLTSEGKPVGLLDTGDKLGLSDRVPLGLIDCNLVGISEDIRLGRYDGMSEDLTVGVELGYGDGF